MKGEGTCFSAIAKHTPVTKMNIERKKIAFIGTGRMGQALIAGLHQAYPKLSMYAYDNDSSRLQGLPSTVKKCAFGSEAVKPADIVVLAVKPQNMKALLGAIGCLLKGKLVISIAAGISIGLIKKNASGAKIVRVMPNNPVIIRAGITAITPDNGITREDIDLVKEMFSAVGEIVEVKESKQDAVVAVSGSGPAYFYKIIDDLAVAGIKAGLDKKTAYRMAIATAYGSSKTLVAKGVSPKEMVEQVKSPKGTTEKALDVMQKKGFSRIIEEAVLAAYKRSKEISAELNS
jgi:pyrroline-5-carboxylate reductase